MEDFYINEPLFCCDVALIKPFMSSNFDPNAVTRLLTEEERTLSNSIGRIITGGTCFIIAEPNAKIMIKNKSVIGLALTNYHVGYNLENRSKNLSGAVEFRTSSGSYWYQYAPIIELNSILEEIQYSNTSEMPYCLPNDLCLILIIDLYDQGSLLQEIKCVLKKILLELTI